jgi:hypothetical protein
MIVAGSSWCLKASAMLDRDFTPSFKEEKLRGDASSLVGNDDLNELMWSKRHQKVMTN